MLSTLLDYNKDLELLIKKGYALSIDSNYLVVRDIPYIDDKGQLQIGAIVSVLVFVNQRQIKMQDHQIFFCGSHPHELGGTPIRNLGGGGTKLNLISDDLVVQRSFSNKPRGGFKNWFDKIESYVEIISGPAIAKFEANPFTFRVVDESSNSVFKYRDTLTSRAEIGDLNNKFELDTIAVIGLGGTGSYLLDFLVKTPVKEIKGFDLKRFHVHNAFRSPGKLEEEELGKLKSEVYKKRYENFRSEVNIYSKYIDSDSIKDLEGVTFAFVCVDKGDSRSEIFELLIKMEIPFIDVGMGLDREMGSISGTLRVSSFSKESARSLMQKKLAPLTDIPDDVYKNNIQISELNALNACLAIIKYKQLRGFYADDNSYYHMLFNIDELNCLGENGKN
ncbi:ThiF family adenylyltransferase [Psychroserpens ponticola]|uniref:ThiF family adenylyltransferase n=1 Tax=Psychroserpens ponticola TaxID=2932268 RepID=A0ABY7S055_9FLAO|nr:ThiF family adenylyltransferase [Psychroserpens ponticola]WCO01320.1 ThiF family adenylyltransferase [Psychroserpens ponticola]